jgi:hypothetical protein
MNSIDSDLTENITTSDICNTPNLNNIASVKTYSHNDKKLLVKRIGDIKNKRCYIKIFKIIHGDNFQYTKNDNGVFFNLTNLPDFVLHKIELVLQHYENKKFVNDQELIKNNNSFTYTEDSDIMTTSDKKRNNIMSSK